MAHASTQRIYMRKGKGEQRVAKVCVRVLRVRVWMGWSCPWHVVCAQAVTWRPAVPRCAQVVDSPCLAEGEASFALSDDGVVDYKE
jgi:hypothetical protein